MRIGITLPQFQPDALAMVEAARRAEREGVDGVFVYDHYPRVGRTEALQGHTMLGAIAVATERVTIGSLVSRIGVVPDAVLVSKLRTAARLAPGRFVAGLGVGDRQSDAEDDALGITRPPLDERFNRLEMVAAQLIDEGIEVWVGGRSRRAATLAAALGATRNLWDPTDAQLKEAVAECPVTWGGTADPDPAKLRALKELGALFAVVAPLRAGAPDAAARLMSAKQEAGLP